MNSPTLNADVFVYDENKWVEAVQDNYLIEGDAGLATVANAIVLPLVYIEGSKLQHGDGLYAGGGRRF